MTNFINTGYFEIVYEGVRYEHLEFIRMDRICDTTYITLRDMITMKMYSFDEKGIQYLRKMIYRFPEMKNQKRRISLQKDSKHDYTRS